MSRMNQGERAGSIQFPDNGFKAVDVPTKVIRVQPRSGRLEPKDGSARELSGEINNGSFQQIRSMVIICDLDFALKNVWEDEKYFDAGIRVIEGIPETEEFKIDLDVSDEAANQPVKPDEAVLGVLMFNTEYAQFDPDQQGFTVTKNASVDVDTGYETEMLVSGKLVDGERFKIDNTGSNELDARVSTIDAGYEFEEAEFTDVTDGIAINDLESAQFYKLELRESGNGNTEADLVFRGEN